MRLYTGIAKGGPRDGQFMGFRSPVMQVNVMQPLDLSATASVDESIVNAVYKICTYTLDEAAKVWIWSGEE